MTTPAERLERLGLGALYPWTPKSLELPGGHTLSYLDEGPQGGSSMLCVHGNPTWSFYYRGLVQAFAGERRVVVPDHIGAGLSDKPQDYAYTLASHVENLTTLVEALDLQRVTLVVHDWGGPIGLCWALLRGGLARVERVVILNTSAFLSRRIPFSIDICRIPGFGALCIRGLNAFARAAVIRASHRGLSREVARGYTGPYGSWADRVANLRFVQDIPMHPGVPSYALVQELERELPRLRELPVLVCWGGRDFCFDDSFLEGFRERLPEAEVVRYADAGHYVLEDAGEQVIERIRALLGQPAAAPA
ncbi:MAG: alpha/beta fold hydrolase [Planctomycetota bacterium]